MAVFWRGEAEKVAVKGMEFLCRCSSLVLLFDVPKVYSVKSVIRLAAVRGEDLQLFLSFSFPPKRSSRQLLVRKRNL